MRHFHLRPAAIVRVLTLLTAMSAFMPTAMAAGPTSADVPAGRREGPADDAGPQLSGGHSGDRRSGQGEGCPAGLPGLFEGPGVVSFAEIRRGGGRVRSAPEGFSQEPVEPAGPLRQGGGPGPQGRFPRAPSRSTAPRRPTSSRTTASSRSPTSIWTSPTPISSRRRRTRSPQYDKALEFYRKALEVGPKADRRVEVELRVAECHQNMGRTGEAAALYQQFSKDHGASPLDIEARYRLGECRLAEGNAARPAASGRTCWRNIAKPVPLGAHRRGAVQPGQDVADSPAHHRRGVESGHGRAGRFHRAIPRAQAGQPGPPGHRPSYMFARPLRQRGAAAEPLPGRPALPGPAGNSRGPQLAGPLYQLQKKFAEALAAWREYLVKHPADAGWSACSGRSSTPNT